MRTSNLVPLHITCDTCDTCGDVDAVTCPIDPEEDGEMDLEKGVPWTCHNGQTLPCGHTAAKATIATTNLPVDWA